MSEPEQTLTMKPMIRQTDTDEERRRRYFEMLAVVDATLRDRARREKCERRALKEASGKQCRALTMKGMRCRRKGWANGLCGIHGGLNVMQVLARRRRKRLARYLAKQPASKGDDRASAKLETEHIWLAKVRTEQKGNHQLAARVRRDRQFPKTTVRT